MSSNKLIVIGGAVVAIAFGYGCFSTGYDKAEAEGELAMQSLKLAQAQEIIAAQNRVKDEYEKKIVELNQALSAARSDNAHRLQQLEQFRSANRDMETCRRDRADLASLAVRGEELLRRADGYLEALK